MSMINRYNFTKNVYKDYLIIIRRKNKYYTFSKDKKILNYINFKDKIYVIKKKQINYLVLDNLDIIDITKYDNNNYNKYLYLSYIDDILLEIRRRLIWIIQ